MALVVFVHNHCVVGVILRIDLAPVNWQLEGKTAFACDLLGLTWLLPCSDSETFL